MTPARLARRPLIGLLGSRARREIWLLFRNAGHSLQPNQKRMKFADRCLDMIMLGGNGCVVSTERGVRLFSPLRRRAISSSVRSFIHHCCFFALFIRNSRRHCRRQRGDKILSENKCRDNATQCNQLLGDAALMTCNLALVVP